MVIPSLMIYYSKYLSHVILCPSAIYYAFNDADIANNNELIMVYMNLPYLLLCPFQLFPIILPEEITEKYNCIFHNAFHILDEFCFDIYILSACPDTDRVPNYLTLRFQCHYQDVM